MAYKNTSQSLICIDSDITTELIIDEVDDIRIKPIDETDRAYLNQFYQNNKYPISTEIKEANHKIYFPCHSEDEAKNKLDLLNKAIRLFFIGNSGILFLFYFDDNNSPILIEDLVSSRYYDGLPRTKLNVEIFNIFRDCYNIIKLNNQDDKLKLITEKYLSATGGWFPSFEARFLDLVLILEVLYHPFDHGNIKHQLSKRASIITYEYIKRNWDINSLEQLYEEFREIYKVRSDLVHSGKTSTDKFSELSARLMDYCRYSILLYAKNLDLFRDEYLLELSPKKDKYEENTPVF